MQAVLSPPGSALVVETETISAPGMSDKVMNGAESIEGATELTTEQRMKTLSAGRCCGDFESPVAPDPTDEFLVAFIGFDTTGEHHAYLAVTGLSSEDGIQAIGFYLQLPVCLDHLGIAMSASGVDVPFSH